MRSLVVTAVTAAATALAASACTPEHVIGADAYAQVVEVPALPNTKLDLLFVIDNSGSMLEEQAELRAKFPLMMDVLSELEGGLPDLHIAVTTSDLGSSAQDGSTGFSVAGCTGTGHDGAFQAGTGDIITGNYIIDSDDGAGGRTRNYDGTLRNAFQQIASLDNYGCGFEQHLGAMARALENPENAGFLRPEANLAVIIVADEDDCTAQSNRFFSPDSPADGTLENFRCTKFGVVCDEPWDAVGEKTNCAPVEDSAVVAGVQPFVDRLLATKPDERMIMVAAIVGTPDPVAVELRALPPSELQPVPALAPSCAFQGAVSEVNPTGLQLADPAVRLAAFVSAFPGRAQLTSICSPDLTAPLVQIGDTAKKLMGDPCVDTSQLADSSPIAGVQPTCEVLEAAGTSERAVPACGAGVASDCYELVADATQCPRSTDHLKLHLRRAAAASADTWTRMRCRVR